MDYDASIDYILSFNSGSLNTDCKLRMLENIIHCFNLSKQSKSSSNFEMLVDEGLIMLLKFINNRI